VTDKPDVRRDRAAGALYARLRDGEVARTIEVSDDAMIDVDPEGQVIGVELLAGDDWPDVLVRLAMAGRLVLRDR
jgi:uncharacterized protein YuzE